MIIIDEDFFNPISAYLKGLFLLEQLRVLFDGRRDLDLDLDNDSVRRSSRRDIRRPFTSWPSYFSMARFMSERLANSTTLKCKRRTLLLVLIINTVD